MHPRLRFVRRRNRRGVSEVVATILLLAMTIVLFASIFLFTTRNPVAQPQALNEFTTALTYGGSGSLQVLTVSITHLSGNVITGTSTAQAAIYVVSQKHPTAIPGPFTLAQGLSGSTVWGFNQAWTLSISSYSINSPDNLTISVISRGVLQYHSTVFALVPSAPPYFSSVQTTPGLLEAKAAYNLSASVDFSSASGDSVKANLSALGGSSGQAMSGPGGTGTYYYDGTAANVSSVTTYEVYLTAIDASGARSTYPIEITVFPASDFPSLNGAAGVGYCAESGTSRCAGSSEPWFTVSVSPTVKNDLLVLVLTVYEQSATLTTADISSSPSATWTLLTTGGNGFTGNYDQYIFWAIDSSTGTDTVTVGTTGLTAHDGSGVLFAIQGVDTSSPIAAEGTAATGTSTTASATVAAPQYGLVLGLVSSSTASGTFPTVTAGSTGTPCTATCSSIGSENGQDYGKSFAESEPGTSAGTYTASATLSISESWGEIAVAINPEILVLGY